MGSFLGGQILHNYLTYKLLIKYNPSLSYVHLELILVG